MDIGAKKIELLDWLLHLTDERKIKKLAAFKNIIDNEVVAQTVSGYPIDKHEYIHLVKEADERINSGTFITIEDLEKEIDNW